MNETQEDLQTETELAEGPAKPSTARTPRFAAWQVVQAAPKPIIAWTLVAINVGLFLWMGLTGVLDADGYLTYGANFGPATPRQLWRLLTCGFIHAGLVHLIFNMGALLDFGVILEQTAGRAKFVFVYSASLLIASAASHAWSPEQLSVGASGAILGLAGHQFVDLPRLEGHALVAEGFRKRMLMWLGAILLLGFLLPLDNAAHLGGFVGGGLIGCYSRMARAPRRGTIKRLLVTGALSVTLVALMQIGNKRMQSDPHARAVAHYLLGIELLKDRQDHAALIELDEAVKLYGAPSIVKRRALARLRTGDRDGARQDAAAGLFRSLRLRDAEAPRLPWIPYANQTPREIRELIQSDPEGLLREFNRNQ